MNNSYLVGIIILKQTIMAGYKKLEDYKVGDNVLIRMVDAQTFMTYSKGETKMDKHINLNEKYRWVNGVVKKVNYINASRPSSKYGNQNYYNLTVDTERVYYTDEKGLYTKPNTELILYDKDIMMAEN